MIINCVSFSCTFCIDLALLMLSVRWDEGTALNELSCKEYRLLVPSSAKAGAGGPAVSCFDLKTSSESSKSTARSSGKLKLIRGSKLPIAPFLHVQDDRLGVLQGGSGWEWDWG